MANQSLNELKKKYPYVSAGMADMFFEINANRSQWERSNKTAKDSVDNLLTVNYGQTHDFPKDYSENGTKSQEMERMVIVTGTTGAGKSATGNTLLGESKFDESSSAVSKTSHVYGKCQDTRTMVVDTPGSWETMETTNPPPAPMVYVFVINVACPRFTEQDLNRVRNIQYPDKLKVVKSGRCVAVLTHADSALQRVTLEDYINEIKGDALHTFLTQDMKGRYLAVNNSADTAYERSQNQKAILTNILKLPDFCFSKYLSEPVKPQGPAHTANPLLHPRSEPKMPQNDQDIAKDTGVAHVPGNADPLGGSPTISAQKEKPKPQSAIVTVDAKDGNADGTKLFQEVQQPKSINKDGEQSRGVQSMLTEDAVINGIIDPKAASSEKAVSKVESILEENGQCDTTSDKEHTTMKLENADEVPKIPGEVLKNLGVTKSGERVNGGILQHPEQENSNNIPPGKTTKESCTSNDIKGVQYPDCALDEDELIDVQHPNCCLCHCKTLLSMKVKEHEQTMQNLLKEKENLTLKNELLKIQLERERQNQGTYGAKYYTV